MEGGPQLGSLREASGGLREVLLGKSFFGGLFGTPEPKRRVLHFNRIADVIDICFMSGIWFIA